MKHVSEIGVLIGCVETRFRDRGIDRSLLCGPIPPFLCSSSLVCVFMVEWGFFLYKAQFLVLFSLSPSLFSSSSIDTMSSPSSSYVQVGLDNLERPLNCSPSPRAQVRGFDWSSLIVD